MAMNSQLDHLDRIAARLQGTAGSAGFGVLSTGEKLYVALAADRCDLLAHVGYTIAEALARIGNDWTRQLCARWQYGTPQHARRAEGDGA